jgi:polar amino acid transport system substrate-binding protein
MNKSRRLSPISAACPTHRSRGKYRLTSALFAALACHAPEASARPLASIESRGVISLCAHPNALPFASRKGERPGFQIELGRALARQLDVGLEVAWVVSPIQYRAAECDIVLDAIVDEQVQAESRMRVSKPYQRSGVALALPASAARIRSFSDLDDGKRIGVQAGSLAQMILGQRGLRITPFGFEDEMIEALAAGTLDGAAVSPASIGYFNLTHPNQAVMLVHAYEHEPDLAWNVAVGMRGSDELLRGKMDAAVDRLLAEGTVRDIYARYGIEHRSPAR